MFGSFPPSLWSVCASKVYSGLGADIVYGIIALKTSLPRLSLFLSSRTVLACSQAPRVAVTEVLPHEEASHPGIVRS
jgi:hypothetical protein